MKKKDTSEQRATATQKKVSEAVIFFVCNCSRRHTHETISSKRHRNPKCLIRESRIKHLALMYTQHILNETNSLYDCRASHVLSLWNDDFVMMALALERHYSRAVLSSFRRHCCCFFSLLFTIQRKKVVMYSDIVCPVIGCTFFSLSVCFFSITVKYALKCSSGCPEPPPFIVCYLVL